MVLIVAKINICRNNHAVAVIVAETVEDVFYIVFPMLVIVWGMSSNLGMSFSSDRWSHTGTILHRYLDTRDANKIKLLHYISNHFIIQGDP